MKFLALNVHSIAVIACASAAMAGCGSSDDNSQPAQNSAELNALPARITNLAAAKTYGGNTDDLLTAGLGKTGLAINQMKTEYAALRSAITARLMVSAITMCNRMWPLLAIASFKRHRHNSMVSQSCINTYVVA